MLAKTSFYSCFTVMAVGLPRIGVSSAWGNGKRVLPVLFVVMFAMWQGSLVLLGLEA
jgi:hypothetical protein